MSLSPLCSVIDRVMSSHVSSYGIDVDSNSFGDLDYADDAALMASDPLVGITSSVTSEMLLSLLVCALLGARPGFRILLQAPLLSQCL